MNKIGKKIVKNSVCTYLKRKVISVMVCLIYLFTNAPFLYSHPENLANSSFIQLWEKRKVPIREGLIMEERFKAIQDAVGKGIMNLDGLEDIDKKTVSKYIERDTDRRRFFEKYPFNYNLLATKDKRLIIMRAEVYKDQKGIDREQFILFYNKQNPPWNLLKRFGVETKDDREWAKRGHWVAAIEPSQVMQRRDALKSLLGLGSTVVLAGLAFSPLACVFDRSGVEPSNVDWGTDAGTGGDTLHQDTVPVPDMAAGSDADSIYTVTAQANEVTSNYLSSVFKPYSSPGIAPTITAGSTLKLECQLTPGSAGVYAGVEFSPYTVENVALKSSGSAASASSYYTGNPKSTSFAPWRAIDGITGKSNAGEWASNGEKTAWWKVDFAKAHDVSVVRIYDRPNLLDHILKADIVFSNGLKKETGPAPNDGKALIVTFPKQAGITWIKIDITKSASTTQNIGLSEVEALGDIPHNDLIAGGLTTLLFNARGNSPFILELDDGKQTLPVAITGLNGSTFRGISIDLYEAVKAIQKNNPAFTFDLTDVTKARIITPDYLVQSAGKAWVEIKGLYKPLPPVKTGARGRLAADPDLNDEQRRLASDKTKDIEEEYITETAQGCRIHYVKKWDGILTPLGFNIDGTKLSAFFVGKDIYMPHPDLLDDVLEDRKTLLATAGKWHKIVLGHELDEAGGIKDHAEVVLNEFTHHSINGLNLADIAVIIFESFTGKLDEDFYERFLANLFEEGAGLFLSEDTFMRIVREMIDPEVNEKFLRTSYQKVTASLDGLASVEIDGKDLSYYAGSFDVTCEKFREESGFAKLIDKPADSDKMHGTIFIDLKRFFIKNTSLSSAVTIDTEYLRRFIAFAKMLPAGVKIAGLTDKGREDIVTGQLITVIKNSIPDSRFNVKYDANFGGLMDKNTETSVYVLTGDALAELSPEAKAQLKIVVPADLGYNRVTDAGYEFYAAWEGLDKSRDEFNVLIYQIAVEFLDHLLAAKKITEEERRNIILEIERSMKQNNGIGFIPSYYDPVQYYKNIESQKALLTAA